MLNCGNPTTVEERLWKQENCKIHAAEDLKTIGLGCLFDDANVFGKHKPNSFFIRDCIKNEGREEVIPT